MDLRKIKQAITSVIVLGLLSYILISTKDFNTEKTPSKNTSSSTNKKPTS